MENTVKEICFEMLSQRGYEVSEDETVIVATAKDDKLIVFYNTSPKLSIENIKYYTNIMHELGFKHTIIIYDSVVTPQANKTIETLQDSLDIELFEKKSLMYNITKHKLVPKHRRLIPCEALEFKEKYGVKIPMMLKTDAVARFYYFKSGDLVEITRTDGIVAYRIVK